MDGRRHAPANSVESLYTDSLADLSRNPNPLGAFGPCLVLSVRPCRARVVFLLFRKIRDHSRLTLLSTLATGGNYTEIMSSPQTNTVMGESNHVRVDCLSGGFECGPP